MLKKTSLFCLILCTLANLSAGDSPDELRFARFQEKVRQDMTTVPNYTCLETIERTHRPPTLARSALSIRFVWKCRA